MTFTLRTTIWGHQYALSIGHRKIRKARVIGYTNRCKDGRYIIFLDLDGTELEWVTHEVRHLQDTYGLSDFYIFRSGEHNYHAVCFDKVNLITLLTIFKGSSVDPNYVNVPMHYGKRLWTLRLSDKGDESISYAARIRSVSHIRPKSTAHMDILAKHFPELEYNRIEEDRERELILSTYLV